MASKQMENLCNTMRMMMKQQGMPMFGKDMDPMILRRNIEASQQMMPLEAGVSIQSIMLGGVEGEACIPESLNEDGVVVYIHGGGLVCGNAFSSRGYATLLAGETKRKVYTLTYRLSPENQYPAAVEDCYQAYKALQVLHSQKPIILVGESAGAYLSITTVLKAKEEGNQLPAAIVPFSPMIDMSGKIDRSENAEKDFTVQPEMVEKIREMYCPGCDLEAPLLSPIYADYEGFPPMLLAWDTGETLAPDSEILAEKARAANVDVRGKGYDDCFHAFAIAGRGTPESAEVLKDTVSFINEQLAKA